jgi:ribosomal protein S13
MNLKTEILHIKQERNDFINSFNLEHENLHNLLSDAVSNSKINSIRVHKLLTENGHIGKVKTMRFLNDIGLDENTKIYELENSSIDKIKNFVESI